MGHATTGDSDPLCPVYELEELSSFGDVAYSGSFLGQNASSQRAGIIEGSVAPVSLRIKEMEFGLSILTQHRRTT